MSGSKNDDADESAAISDEHSGASEGSEVLLDDESETDDVESDTSDSDDTANESSDAELSDRDLRRDRSFWRQVSALNSAVHVLRGKRYHAYAQ